jgi:hypothetical protein
MTGVGSQETGAWIREMGKGWCIAASGDGDTMPSRRPLFALAIHTHHPYLAS